MRIRTMIRISIACLTGLIAFSGVARADDKADIQTVLQKTAKAMSAKDTKGVMAYATKDFSYTADGKTMSGEQVTAQMQQQFQAISGSPKFKFTVLSCEVKGKAATVLLTDEMTLQMAGQDNKPHTIAATTKSKMGLVKTGKSWLIKSETVLSRKATMDGKPINPQGGASQ